MLEPIGRAASPSNARLTLLGGAALLCCLAYLTVGLRGNIAFVLELRGLRLGAMLVVSVAVAISTVVFQTVSANRILTPSIMGLDALYILCQTALVFILSGLGFAGLDPLLAFVGNAVVMVAMALLLFLPMLSRSADLTLLLLTGVVLGVLFRSLTSMLARMIDPNEFAVLQGAVFASFGSVRLDTLTITAGVTALGAIVAWRMRYTLDVIALGGDAATGLGIDWRKTLTGLLILVAVLVAASTALVGPLAFLGLLVSAIAVRVADSERHALLLPVACGVSIIVLVGSQTLLQHVFGGAGTLSLIVEFAGGLVFLAMLFSGARR
jgi:iron complex transport system permease protein